MCEVDGVPISEATWLDWPWLRRRTVVRGPSDPLRNRGPRRRRATDPKDPGPDVLVLSDGRRRRVRRGNPPASVGTETWSGSVVGGPWVARGIKDRGSTRGGVKGSRGTPR